MELGIGCCCGEPLNATITRLCELVGPLNDDATLEGYDAPWEDGTKHGKWPRTYVKSDRLPYPGVTFDGTTYEMKVKPLRHRIGYSYLGPQSYLGSGAMRTAAAEAVYETTAIRNKAVPAGSHCYPLTLTTVYLPVLISNLNITAILGSFTLIVSHARMLVNGVDVTGIVPVSVQLNNSSAAGPTPEAYRYTAASSILLSTPNITIDANDLIEWDVWVKMTYSSTYFNGVGVTNPQLLTFEASYYGASIYNHGEPSFLWRAGWVDVNKNIRRQRWKIVLPGDSPFLFSGSMTELNLAAQSGWTCVTSVPGRITMTDTTRGDTVTMIWNREIPEVILGVAQNPGSVNLNSINVRYQPAGTAYEAWEFGQHGVWNPRAATMFGLTMADLYQQNRWLSMLRFAEFPGQVESNFTSRFPASISVEPF